MKKIRTILGLLIVLGFISTLVGGVGDVFGNPDEVTVSFYPTNDVDIYARSTSYTAAHNATSGSLFTFYGGIYLLIGQQYYGVGGSNWNEIHRVFFNFNTSSLPDDCTIISAELKVHHGSYSYMNNPYFYIRAVPHTAGDTFEGEDYDEIGTTNGGEFYSGGWSTGGYNTITLNSTGLSWISKTGTTYLGLRSRRDIESQPPAYSDYVPAFATEQSGANQDPYLSVTYTLPNDSPSISSVSDSPDPAAVGSGVSFGVNWSDPDSGDQTKTHICKTNAISGQTCPGGSWCDTATWSTTSPSSCNYTTQATDVGTQNYYAFVCDDSDACSSATSGTFSVTPAYTPAKTMCAYSTGSGGGVVSAGDVISPDPDTNPLAVSARGWVVTGYDGVAFPTYLELQTMYGYTDSTTQTITNLSDVTGNGIYKVTADDLEIAPGDDPPCDSGFSAVIFVDNDLIIGRSFTDDTVSGDPLGYKTSCGSSLAFIVEKDIKVAGTVNNIYGIFYSEGDVGMSTESSPNPLYVFGSLLAHSFALGRNLGADNATYPAEQVIFMPKYFITLKDVLGRSQVSWKEVK